VNGRIGVFGFLVVATASSAAEMRTWTFEKSGKTIRAEVSNFVGTNMVALKGADGKSFTVPIAYLVESNRVFLAAELAEQWKEVEVVRLEGTASGGRYKRCTVRGKGVGHVILVDLLPPAVESILKVRNQKEAQIAELQSWMKRNIQTLTPVEIVVHDPSMALGYNTNPVYRVKDVSALKAEAAETNLLKLETAFTDYNAQTKAATTVKMKKTGLVYEGLPVWECFDPRKRQP
jgi:hypothetical protein